MFDRIRRTLRFAPLVLALVAATTFLLAWPASHIEFDFTLERLFESNDETMDHYRRFQETFGGDDELLLAAYSVPDVLDPEALRTVGLVSDRLASVDRVRAVFSLRDAAGFLRKYRYPEEAIRTELTSHPLFSGALLSPDARTAALWIILDRSVRTERERTKLVDRVRAILDEEKRGSGWTFHLAGIPVVEREYTRLSLRDILTFTPVAVGLFVLLLGFYFRSLLGTILPLVTVAIGVAWTVGFMSLAGISLNVMTSLVPNLLLVIGISDTLHILSRYQEDLPAASEKRDALARTVSVMLTACFLTSFTTSIGFGSLLTTKETVIRHFGIACAVGFLLVYVAMMTFLPSLLALAPPLRGRTAGTRMARFADRAMERLADFNLRNWGWIWAFWGAVTAGSVALMLRIEWGSSWLQDIRADNPVHRAHAFLEERLSPVFTVDLEIDGGTPGAMKHPVLLRRIAAFQKDLRTIGADRSFSYVDLVRELHRARRIALRTLLCPPTKGLVSDPSLRAIPRSSMEIRAALALAKPADRRYDLLSRVVSKDYSRCRISLRIAGLDSRKLGAFLGRMETLHRERYAGVFSFRATGKSVLAMKAVDDTVGNMTSSFWLAAALILVCMWTLFGSFVVGLLAMIPNLIPMVATAGLMGALGIDLNFSTATVFSISLGIAVDSTIHYLSRLRLELEADPDPAVAMCRTLAGAGRPMIFGTLLLVLGFGSILTSNFRFTFHFGLLGGFSLLVALLCDLTITPTLMYVARPRVTGRISLWTRLRRLLHGNPPP